MIKDFKKFISQGNLINLAVAFVIGAAFENIVSSLVKDLITPIISALGGKPNFSQYYFIINHSHFYYGSFVNSVLSFLIISLVVFFLIVKPTNKLLKINQPSTSLTKECPKCLSQIPSKATKCAFCTANLVS